jgi:Na+-translocating ferredoxin:NAD+ oxidoreductase RnfG subunit
VFCLNHGTDDQTVDMGDGEWTDLLTGATVTGRAVVGAREAVVARRNR